MRSWWWTTAPQMARRMWPAAIPAMLVAMGERVSPLGFRYAYLPSAAFCVLVAQGAGKIKNEKVSRIFHAVVLVAFAAGAVAGAVRWSDPAGLWEEVARRHGDKAMLYVNQGALLISMVEAGAGGDALARAIATDDERTILL